MMDEAERLGSEVAVSCSLNCIGLIYFFLSLIFAMHVLKMRLRLWWPGCEGMVGASVTQQHITATLEYEGPFLRISHVGTRVERSTIYFETQHRHTL